MSSPEESPAQRAARQRRERREAKIKASGSARLDKITSLSGRTPASAREDASPSPTPQPTSRTNSPAVPPIPSSEASSRPSPPLDGASNEDLRAQQEYLRALLRSYPPEQQNQQQIDQDPMLKLLGSMLGGVPGAENTAPGSGFAPSPAPGNDLKPDDLASALGLPPFLSKFLLGGGSSPVTPAQAQQERLWKLIHTVFSLVVGLYLVFLVGSSIATYGTSAPPPPPAAAQNPFVVFMTGELLLNGIGVLLGTSQPGTLALGKQLLSGLVRDGSIAIFVLGVGSWWNGGWDGLGTH